MSKVVIPDTVFDSLEVVRISGITNMFDIRVVQELVTKEASDWIEDNRDKYIEGIFYGFTRQSEVVSN